MTDDSSELSLPLIGVKGVVRAVRHAHKAYGLLSGIPKSRFIRDYTGVFQNLETSLAQAIYQGYVSVSGDVLRLTNRNERP